MSFLDNLENNLKSLESHEEGKEDAARQQRARQNERSQAQAAAPHAEALKKGPYTAELLRQATRIGHALRTKVHIAWIGSTLRLEARERRLELRPNATGIVAVYLENNQEQRSEPLDLNGNPEDLLRPWLEAR
ncbi:conserved hypothetical protein [Candidatus Sulfopaludibacter sp. SbA4]|nr:conserved hypothetical protein [Candidatus Sulfopaludibacter sp. SbA4]